MGFMDKLKEFFYDEEEIDEGETQKKAKQPEKKVHRSIIKEEKEIPERELFKAERTFNFPMDMDDEPDFVPVKSSIKHSKEENNTSEPQKISREMKREKSNAQVSRPYSANIEKKEEKKEEKKFKPTPIISPIYGIVDGSVLTKNESSSITSTRDFSVTKKIDFDTVRKKAYGDIHADDEENENKGLFFNLVDEDKKEIDDEIEESTNINEEDDIKITYNDIDYDSEEEKENEEIEVPKITRLRKNKKKEIEESDEDAILSETKEQDLFNLIDNMYNSEEDDEEE